MNPFACLAILLVTTCACRSAPAVVVAQPPPPPHLRVQGRDVPFYAPWVLSISDDNSRFLVTLETTLQPGPLDFRAFEFECAGERLKPDFEGDDEHSGFFAFRADANQARTFARALGVSVTNRQACSAKLVGRLELVPGPQVGTSRSMLKFTLSNDGGAPVWVNCGEHAGPVFRNDSRFMLEIEPEGLAFVSPPFDLMRGAQEHLRLGPGESRAFELDPSGLCEDLLPGKYAIRATFDAEFTPVDWTPGTGPVGWEEHVTRRCCVSADLALELP